MGLRVGIDFGTSNSGVAIYDGQRVQVLPVDQQTMTPEVIKTILYITRDHRTYIGQEAVELYYRQNVNRLRRFERRWVGEIDIYGADMHYVDDVYAYIDELAPGRLLQFIKTALRSERYSGTQIFDRFYSLVDLIAAYLGQLKQRAERLLGAEIEAVTLGRPVKFSALPELDQRAETILRQAALQAGFQAVQLELEPIAAALFYETSLDHPQTALIFDFGGGTLDVTILRLGDPHDRRVYASGGIAIAGSDFDRAIIHTRLLSHFGEGQMDPDPELENLIHAVPDWIALPELSTPKVRARLEQAIQQGQVPVRLKALEALIFNDLAFSFYNTVEAAKIALSAQGAAVIHLRAGGLDLWELYTRNQFEKDIRLEAAQIEQFLLETLRLSGLHANQIEAVVTTGGSSNIPCFTAMLSRLFGASRIKASGVFSSVTAGLAIRARQM